MPVNRVELHALDCVGCGNCKYTCPKHAIEMCPDQEGFLYPSINQNLCVNCGKCILTCPMYQDQSEKRAVQKGFIAITKDKEIYRRAASGGMFGTIAQCFLDRYTDGMVIGAAYTGEYVEHIIVESRDGIASLQNSKYVQSKLNTVFAQIREALKAQKKVLFSGTPCQVNALYLYLAGPHANLFTIDLICHGVPSPEFLKKDLTLYSNAAEQIRFRRKNRFGKSGSYFILQVISGKKTEVVIGNRDPYYSLFLNGDSYRESCYRCKFTNMIRCGDLTLGDCDSHAAYPAFHSREATNCIMVNSENGEALMNLIRDKIDFAALDLRLEQQKNTQLAYPSTRTEIRDRIYQEINENPIAIIRRKYARKRDWKEKLLLLKCEFLP